MLCCFIHLNDLAKTFLKCFTCWRTFSGSRDIAKNRRERQYIGFCGPEECWKALRFCELCLRSISYNVYLWSLNGFNVYFCRQSIWTVGSSGVGSQNFFGGAKYLGGWKRLTSGGLQYFFGERRFSKHEMARYPEISGAWSPAPLPWLRLWRPTLCVVPSCCGKKDKICFYAINLVEIATRFLDMNDELKRVNRKLHHTRFQLAVECHVWAVGTHLHLLCAVGTACCSTL